MAEDKYTEEERERYRSRISVDQKIRCMELYLLKGDTTNEVGAEVFGNAEWAHDVSLVLKANRTNPGKGRSIKGKYGPGSSFQKTYNYEVTRSDIELFIKQYEPYGSYDHESFKEWLIKRAKAKKSTAGQTAEASGGRVVKAPSAAGPRRSSQKKNNIFSLKKEGNAPNANAGLFIGLALLIAIILIVIFRKTIMAVVISIMSHVLFILLSGVLPAVIVALIIRAILRRPPKALPSSSSNKGKSTQPETRKLTLKRTLAATCIIYVGFEIGTSNNGTVIFMMGIVIVLIGMVCLIAK